MRIRTNFQSPFQTSDSCMKLFIVPYTLPALLAGLLFHSHYDAGFFPLVILLLPPEKIGHRRMYHRRMFLPVTCISQYAAITVLSSHLCSSIDLFDGIGFPASFGCEETEQFKSHTSAHVRTITTTTYCQRG